MPYITQEKRRQLDPAIDELHRILTNIKIDDESANTEGCVNYSITRLLMLVYGDKDSARYGSINDALGVLDAVGKEYYRKVAVPYEDQKEFENGVVEINPTKEVVGTVNVVDPRNL